jgi:hypothetical protein
MVKRQSPKQSAPADDKVRPWQAINVDKPAATAFDRATLPMGYTVPADVVSVSGDRVVVRPLAQIPPMEQGQEAELYVRPAKAGAKAADPRKLGLKAGSTVELDKVFMDVHGRLCAARVQALLPKDAPKMVYPDALIGFLPTPKGQPGPEHLVMLPNEGRRIDLIELSINPIREILFEDGTRDPVGKPGFVLRGPLPEGGVFAWAYDHTEEDAPLPEKPDARVLEERLRMRRFYYSVPDYRQVFEKIRHKRVRGQWEIVRYAVLPIDPDRRSRIHALAANHPFVGKDWQASRFVPGVVVATPAPDGTWQATYASPLVTRPTLVGFDYPPGFSETMQPEEEWRAAAEALEAEMAVDRANAPAPEAAEAHGDAAAEPLTAYDFNL